MTSKKEERGFWDRHRNRISGRAEGEQEELAEKGVCWGTPCGPGGGQVGVPSFPAAQVHSHQQNEQVSFPRSPTEALTWQ